MWKLLFSIVQLLGTIAFALAAKLRRNGDLVAELEAEATSTIDLGDGTHWTVTVDTQNEALLVLRGPTTKYYCDFKRGQTPIVRNHQNLFNMIDNQTKYQT